MAVVVLLIATGCRRGQVAAKRPARAQADAAISAEAPRAQPPAATLTETPADRPGGSWPSSGALKVQIEAEPSHLNPLADGNPLAGRVVTGLVYETLIECHADRYVPALAESWETSPDGLRLSLRLRSGVRWHDDHPLTTLDVQATFETVLRATSHLPLVRTLLGDVAAVEIAADRVVRLRLHRPSHLVLRALCEVPILPESALRGGPSRVAALGRLPVGTGPFRIAAWEHGRRIRLARNRGSWRDHVFLDEIVFEIEPDAGKALARARRGELDVVPHLLDLYYPDQVEPAALQDTLALYRLTPARWSFLLINLRREPLVDLRFRRALGLLWDRERMASEVHRGLARPITAPPFGAPTAVGAPGFDRAGAVRELESGGYRDGDGDGVRDRNGVAIRLTLLVPIGARSLLQEARAFAHDLRRAGLLLDIVSVDSATLLSRVAAGQFDLAPMVWDGRVDEDPRPLFGAQSNVEHAGYRSDRLAAFLDELRGSDGPTARRPVLRRIADLLAAELPVIFLYRHDVPALVARRVHGLAGQGAELDLRGVWVDP